MLKLFKPKRQKSAISNPKSAIPQHIAFICDGNRRWATKRGLSPLAGHRAGVGDFSKLVDYFIGHGVSTLSFYIFSTENWDRTSEEIDFLMKLYEEVFDKNYKDAKSKNLRFRIVGRRDRIPTTVLEKSLRLERETADNTGGTVVFALDHGGQDEIVRAAAAAIEAGIPADQMNIETFETFMDTGDIIPVDFLVRTSNEQRISNFLLWKNAYAEMLFVPEHWPDFVSRQDSWDKVLAEYSRRNRRFGGGKYENYAGE